MVTHSLRPYQTAAIESTLAAWQEHQNVLGVAATGAGKTQIFLSIITDLLGPSQRGLILAHRQELIDQPLERLRSVAPEWLAAADDKPRVGVMMAERNECDRQLTIATVQTLASQKRLAQLLAHGPIDYLIVDECHHSVSPSYMKLYLALLAANPNLKVLGVSATPQRADGDGMSKLYTHVAFKITIADLVQLGWLVKPRWLGIKTGISLAGIKSSGGDFVQSQLAVAMDTSQGRDIMVRSWQKYASSCKTMAFTVSVQGAYDLAQSFMAAGVTAAAADGTTPKDERRHLLAEFRAGRIQVLCNCGLWTEGFDDPGIQCVMIGRPTKSDGLYCQMIGRGFRPELGKALPDETCLILDYMPKDTRNVVCAGDVLGLPKELTEHVKKEQDEQLEIGDVLAGFTFDGEHFRTDGTPLDIIARQLDYLNDSPFAWHRDGDTLTLGLGPGSDGRERILAILPVNVEQDQYDLYGLQRKPGTGQYKWQPWQQRHIQSGTLADLGLAAQTIADRWATPLNEKGKAWRNQFASDSQLAWLKKLAKGRIKMALFDTMTKGQAALYISHYTALQALKVGWV